MKIVYGKTLTESERGAVRSMAEKCGITFETARLLYARGITSAGIRWLVDHTEESWMPHNKPETYAPYAEGLFDGCFPDTFNCVTGNYGGMVIPPDTIARNIYAILDGGFGK